MRGYQALKRSGRLDRIAAVKEALTEHALGLPNYDFSPVVMGHEAKSGESIVRQYLLTRLGGVNLHRALLLASGKSQGRVVFYLPKEWREVLSRHGFDVASFRSAVLWQLYVFAFLLYGVLKIGNIVVAGIGARTTTDAKPKRHVYFADLSSGNLPQQTYGSQSHDVISWYLQWSGRTAGIEAVHHSVANALPTSVDHIVVSPRGGPLADLADWHAAASYALWGLRASFIAVTDYVRGRWWHALLLNQAALLAQARTLPAELLAREYLFHNSGWIYRPLWTYEAERRGAAITFYFYSTNCEAFKRWEGYPPLPYGWKAMTWPRYLVWDECQADFVRRAVGGGANISIVGSIWFQGSAMAPRTLPSRTIAVFDVQPHREARYRLLALPFDYYTPRTVNQFLSDIYETVKRGDCSLALKRKREIGQLAHPKYRHCVEKLNKLPNFIAVDPEVSASQLIDDCVAVISMPFTSTALLGRELGKPSIYYDPYGVLEKGDRAAHGIEILSGPDDLRRWLTAVLERESVRELSHA